MGVYILSRILGRVARVALAVAAIAPVCLVSPAFAAEDEIQVAQAVTPSGGSGPLNIVLTDLSKDLSEPLSVASDNQEEPEQVDFSKEKTLKVPIRDDEEEFSFPIDEEIYEFILQVKRKNEILSRAFIGLEQNYSYFIPLQELARLLEFETEVNLQAGIAQGRFLSDIYAYSIDTKNLSYTVRGDAFPLPINSFIVKTASDGTGDIYLSQEIVNKILPLRLELDTFSLSLNITTPKKLPYELKRERQKLHDSLLAGGDAQNDLDLQYIQNGYKNFTLPSFVITDSLGWDGSEKSLINTSSFSGRGDILGATADYNASVVYEAGETPDLINARLRFTRKGFANNRTLPFGLKLFQAGDISSRPSSFITSIVNGRGVSISSDPEANSQAFDEITIQGTGEPGWEIEIYRGRHLIDFGFVDDRGEYIFENVQLFYGKNIIRTVLYGPNGQIVEKSKEYRIDRKQLRPGESSFEASLIDYKKNLIQVNDTAANGKDTGVAKFIRVNRGINHWLSGFATATSVPTLEGDKKYLTVGGLFDALGGDGQVELYKEIDGGAGVDTRFSTRLAGVNTQLRASVFRDFESQRNGFGDSARTFEGSVRLNKNYNLGRGSLGLNLSSLYTRYEDKSTSTQVQASQLFSVDRLHLSNTSTSSFTNNEYTGTSGQIGVNKTFTPNWSFRSTLSYKTNPTFDLETLQAGLNYDNKDKFTGALNVSQGVSDTGKTSVNLRGSYDFDTYLGSAEANWSRDDGLDLMLRGTTGFGPDENGDYYFSSQFKNSGAQLRVRLFHDKNSNGLFDGNDEPVSRGRIFVNNKKSGFSDESGIIDMKKAGAEGIAIISVDPEDLPNSFYAPLVGDGYEVILRPGTKPFIDFALIETGSIDGFVFGEDGLALPRKTVQLINDQGIVLEEAMTSLDGFYLFEFVRPGTYVVQVDPSLQVNVPPKSVLVSSDDLFAYGVDLKPVEQAEEVSTTSALAATGDRGGIAQLDRSPVVDGTLQPAPFSTDGIFPAIVSKVRIGEYPSRVRLVLDLSVMAPYRLTSERDGTILNIDMPGTAWDAPRTCVTGQSSIFVECGVFALPNESGTRLRLVGKQPIRINYNTALPAVSGKSPRIYLDFLK